MKKTPDELTNDIIKKNFKMGAFGVLMPDQQSAVRECIKQALGTGRILSLVKTSDPDIGVEQSQLMQEMAEEAIAFEATLDPETDITKLESETFPWGWRYASWNLQERFKQFVVSRNKE